MIVPSLACAEDDKENVSDVNHSVDDDENEDEANSIAIEAQSFADLFRSQAQSSFKGVVLGNILALTDDYVYVKPIERDLGRMYIYIDNKTMFSKMSHGKRQRGKKEYLIDGERVAARVLMKEGIILADEVFLVEGDFESRSRYRKLSYKKRKSDEDGGAEKGAASHGAAKPKSGGHH